MNFVFYDTETTGTKTAFDQILQFAAIYTDSEFQEIDRFEIRCRLLPYIVPAPKAMLVTGVTVGQLLDPSLPTHYEMMMAIRKKLLSWSPAVFIGHNSLKFDEPLLRQAFYQTLHPIYLTNNGGNCRSDTLSIIQAASLFAPNALKFPINDKGDRLFKLDRLAPLNGFNHANAHDALGDVEATIYMCKIVQNNAPEVWNASMRFNQKKAVSDFVKNELICSLSEFYYGKPYSWLVAGIGVNPSDASELFLFDLANDPIELKNLTDEQIVRLLKESPKPIRRIRANSSPILMSFDKAPVVATSIALGVDELRRRAEGLRADDRFREKLIALMISAKEPLEPKLHVEEQIYDGFPSRDDEELMADFHEVPWQKKLEITQRLKDARSKTLGLRLLYSERPELFNKLEYTEYQNRLFARLLGDQENVPWRTLPAALKEIDELLVSVDKSQTALLQEHREYLMQWLTKAKHET